VKVDIRDRETLFAVRPSDMAAYLRAHGWAEQQQLGQSWAAFTLADYEVTLPLTTELRDYRLRMAETLQTLEMAENRDQLQILADLAVTASDVVRVRIPDPDSTDGTLSLDRAVAVVNSTHGMMLAAACAAVSPKLYYASRKPNDASHYMRNVRMGQTERGSFIVTVYSRLPPTPPVEQEAELGLATPFQRKVTEKLATAMTAATAAATQTVATGAFGGFEAAVERGVSANLCDALAKLGTQDGMARNVEIALSWAQSRPQLIALRNQFTVTPDIAPVFYEAAKLLKSKAPREEFEVRGPVFRLVRDPPTAVDGEVTIAATVDGTSRNIWISLTGQDYQTAVQAHGASRYVSAIGVLKKDGRSYRLTDPRNVRILEDENEVPEWNDLSDPDPFA
jgi:hypothetical protein